ncbi:MAG: ABC transporter ATP-binding protein [Burkholderiaceae bacterium]|nr:ABC transporter ATP-binding protein [Burkholderiaceae bacterium]
MKVGDKSVRLANDAVGTNRLREVGPEASATLREPSVQVQGVSHVFPDGTRAIADIDLTLHKGEFVSIVGPSGCGKTTVLNLVAGLLPLQSGSLSVDGTSPRAGRHDVAYMLARDCLFPWRTALENAMLGNEFRRIGSEVGRTRAMEFLRRVGLERFCDQYPKALSHGMRQRVALARTFALQSGILLMDEPFGALDAQTKLQLEDVLMALWNGERRTVLFITHDLAEAVTLSDRVVVMSARPGRIVDDLPIPLARPRSVRALQRDPAYHELYAKIWSRLEAAVGQPCNDESTRA